MKKHNPFSPDYYVEPNFEKEMKRMHTSEYVASSDAEDILQEDTIHISPVSPESTREPLQPIVESLSHNERVLQEIREGHFTHMGELTSVSVDAAHLLLARSFLDLRSVEHLSPEAAGVLGKHRGRLILLGLMSLDLDVAQALGAHEGFLDLSGVTYISLENARALAYQKGDLRMTGLTLDFSPGHARESAEILDAFAFHEGEVILSSQLQKQFDDYKKQHQAA